MFNVLGTWGRPKKRKLVIMLAVFSIACFSLSLVLPVSADQSSNQLRGIAVNWCFYDFNTHTKQDILAAWQQQIPWLHSFGFNSIRLAIAPDNSLAGQRIGINDDALTAVIDLLGSNGFGIVLDEHNWYGNMQGSLYGSQAWHDFWMHISSLYRDNGYVWAYEPMNEPIVGGMDVSADMTTPLSIENAYGWLISDLRSSGDNKVVILPDPSYWQSTDAGDPISWATNSQPQQSLMYQPKLIESTHNYGFTFNGMVNGLTYEQTLAYYEHKLLAWRNVAVTISGEWGFTNYHDPNQFAWAHDWLSFLNNNNIGYFYYMGGYPSEYIIAQRNFNWLIGAG